MDALLYLDQWLVAVDKPSGEIVHPGWARGEPTTMSRVRDVLKQWVYPLHRLDRGTSGVVLLARAPDVARAVAETWAHGGVEKRYLALVRGAPPDDGVIDYPLRRSDRGDERVPAQTAFRRLGRSAVARCSLVEARPRSGRLHQIRRHLRHLSHPIVGDVRYGDGRINRTFRADFGLRRLALHAASLRLVHPVTGAELSISADVPEDLARPIALLGLEISPG